MAINLYELFHRYYQLGLPAVLGPDGTALYWALIQKSNELRDPAQFTFTNTEARDRTGIDHPEKFDRARQKLIQAGLVTYKAGHIHRTGIYSGLDRELDPGEVAARFGRLVPDPVDRSPRPPRQPPLSTDSPTINPQYPQVGESSTDATHNQITPDSQGDHIPLTPGSHADHNSLKKLAPDVSITREEDKREEQRDPNASMQQEEERTPARAQAERVWSKVVIAVSPQCTVRGVEALHACRVVSDDGVTLTVTYPADPDFREIIQRYALLLERSLREVGPRTRHLAWILHDARAGPEEADTS